MVEYALALVSLHAVRTLNILTLVFIVSFTSLSHSLPKSGRRSDGLSHHTVQRKELKYSAPPRGRGGGRTNLEGGLKVR